MAITQNGLIKFVSDEYGPYIYTIENPTGHIIAATAPPAAILPVSALELTWTRCHFFCLPQLPVQTGI